MQRGTPAMTDKPTTTADKLRKDLTPEQRDEALRIGRIEFASAGAVRKR